MRRTSAVLWTAGLALLLAGCWPVPGQNPDRTAYNAGETTITPANAGQLDEVWTWSSGVTSPVTHPVVSTGGVHVQYGRCGLATVDVATGALSWGYAPGSSCSFQSSGTPFVVGETLYLGGTVFVISPNPSGRSFDGFTTGVDVATGARVASTSAGSLEALRGDIAIGTDGVYDPWTQTTFKWATIGSVAGARRRINGLAPTEDSITIGTDRFFQASALYPEGSQVRAFSATDAHPGCGPTGTNECPLWATEVPGVVGPPVLVDAGRTVYLGSSDGSVHALDGATGAIVWSGALGAAAAAPPALAEGRLYVPTVDGRVVVFAAGGCGQSTCPPLWDAVTGPGAAIRTQPAVAGPVLYTGSADGGVHAFAAAGCGDPTCAPLFAGATGSQITGAPAVSNGQLYVGTADGRLVAYGLP